LFEVCQTKMGGPPLTRIGLQGCARSCSPILYNDGSGPPHKPDVVIGRSFRLPTSHCFLLISKRNPHLLERSLIQSSRDLDALRGLKFLETFTGSSVEFSGLVPRVESALLQN